MNYSQQVRDEYHEAQREGLDASAAFSCAMDKVRELDTELNAATLELDELGMVIVRLRADNARMREALRLIITWFEATTFNARPLLLQGIGIARKLFEKDALKEQEKS